jgi:hypothetical protein
MSDALPVPVGMQAEDAGQSMGRRIVEQHILQDQVKSYMEPGRTRIRKAII